MPKFDYTAKTSDGGIVRGTSDAESADALRARLEKKGFSVEQIEAHRPKKVRPDTEAQIARVAETILRTAIEEGVEHIDIEPSADATTVLYAVGQEHHEVMTIPAYVWSSLLKEFCKMAGAPEPKEGSETGGPFQFEADGKTYEILFMGSTAGARLEITPE